MADKNSLWTWDNQQKYHEKIMQEIEDNATGGTGSLTIDTELSDTSENPVQNKIIAEEFNKRNVKSYTSLEQIGCTSASTLKEVWEALPDYSELIINAEDVTDPSWNLPHTIATIHMYKFIRPRPVCITIYPKSTAFLPMYMTVDTDGYPTGVWKRYADGGDANTVDGKHAADFLPNKQTVNGGNYDDFITTGFYELLGDETTPTTNCPLGESYDTNNNFFLIVQRRSDNYVNHIAINVRKVNDIYTRTKDKGTWYGWVRISDGGNADTLDGLHSTSFFQEIGALHSGSIKDYALSLVGSGAVFVHNNVTDTPSSDEYWFATINKCNTNHILIEITSLGSNKQYVMTYNSGTTTWSDWRRVGDGGAATSIQVDKIAPTKATTYYPILVDSATSTSENLETSNGLRAYTLLGTADTEGYVNLQLGNNVLAGTEGNLKGRLVLYNNVNTYYAILQQNTNQTANRTITLPASAGILALTTDTVSNATSQATSAASSPNNSQLRNIASGTAAATTSNCPNGCLYGQYN